MSKRTRIPDSCAAALDAAIDSEVICERNLIKLEEAYAWAFNRWGIPRDLKKSDCGVPSRNPENFYLCGADCEVLSHC